MHAFFVSRSVSFEDCEFLSPRGTIAPCRGRKPPDTASQIVSAPEGRQSNERFAKDLSPLRGWRTKQQKTVGWRPRQRAAATPWLKRATSSCAFQAWRLCLLAESFQAFVRTVYFLERLRAFAFCITWSCQAGSKAGSSVLSVSEELASLTLPNIVKSG